jgi:hypothetical protein
VEITDTDGHLLPCLPCLAVTVAAHVPMRNRS